MESNSVLDISKEEFNALEWDDKFDTLFTQLDAIIASGCEEQDAILNIEDAPIAPHVPTASMEIYEATPTTPTTVVARTT